MAEAYRIIQDAFLTHLVGLKPDGQSRHSPLLMDRPMGLFGSPVAYFCVVEEQARGTPHFHGIIWGGLPPTLLQAAAGIPELLSPIYKIIDQMVTAELKPKTLAKQLLGQIDRVPPGRPSLQQPHHPFTQPSEFSEDVESAGAVTNIHSHTFTCHKGKQGKISCRLSRPAPFAEATNSVQLLPSRDLSTKKVVYEVLDEPLPPHVDCLLSRNISRTPVSKRDSNLHHYEIKRPLIHLRTGNEETIDEERVQEVKSF